MVGFARLEGQRRLGLDLEQSAGMKGNKKLILHGTLYIICVISSAKPRAGSHRGIWDHPKSHSRPTRLDAHTNPQQKRTFTTVSEQRRGWWWILEAILGTFLGYLQEPGGDFTSVCALVRLGVEQGGAVPGTLQ